MYSSVAVVVALTTLAQIGTVMGIAIFPVIAPRLAAEMGVEPSLVGFQMSLIYGAAMLSSPFLTWMVTRHGACRAIQAGLLVSVVALVLALVPGLPSLIVASILLGAAKPLHILTSTATVRRLVNMTALTAVDAGAARGNLTLPF